MTILVTGAAGFIGSNLIKALCRSNSSVWGDNLAVVGVDNLNSYYDPQLKQERLDELEKLPGFVFVKGNIADKGLINSIFQNYKPSIVVNLAAQAGVRYSITDPDVYIESNIFNYFKCI